MNVPAVRRTVAVFAALGAASSLATGCPKVGCLAGDDPGCVVPSPCTELAFDCDDDALVLRVITPGDDVPGGVDALGSVGDVLLGNSKVTAVINALDAPMFLSPSGGMLIDLSTTGNDDDALNSLFQAAGALPEDAFEYTSMEFLSGDDFRGVLVKGHLAGAPHHRVATRYEVRSCEPGVRVRTELVNGGPDDRTWANVDGYWWAKESALAFTPAPGAGYVHPDFGLDTLNDVFIATPFIAAASVAQPASSYGVVACNLPAIEGFHSTAISAAGGPRVIVPPGDFDVYERFVAVASGRGAQPGADVAFELRRQLFDEPFVTITGTLRDEAGVVPADWNRGSVFFLEGETPLNHAVPGPDGRFSARVPASAEITLEVRAFGRTVLTKKAAVGENDEDVGELQIPQAGALTLSVLKDGMPGDAIVEVVPANAATRDDVSATFLGGSFATICAPYLGFHGGASPACNHVLVRDPVTFELPPGDYLLFAHTGPFATLAQAPVTVTEGSREDVSFSLTSLSVVGRPYLAGDFHVHGRASWDSTIPDLDRVRAFLASDLDVIVATDHDVAWNYADAIEQLDAEERMVLMTGVEATPYILWDFNPDVTYPQVIGHWNFWPMPFVADAARRGAPWDELLEPAELFQRMRAGGLDEGGVIEMNHPISPLDFGRDFGWGSAIGVRLDRPLPDAPDGTGPGRFHARPGNGTYKNSDYDVQEVLNGNDVKNLLPDRAFWFYLLNQGIVKGGVANSDSHSLSDTPVGSGRTIVFTTTTHDDFDPAVFNRDVKAGRTLGTNGPVVDAAVLDGDAAVHTPSLTSFVPGTGARLAIRVTAAPWIPVDEVRVVVNGVVKKTIDDDLAQPADPFGEDGVLRWQGDLDLDDLLPAGTTDAWLVVEAGHVLPEIRDEDGDSLPDPLAALIPKQPDDDGFAYDAVTLQQTSYAFTSPFLLDRNGDGFTGPGLPRSSE